METVSASGSRGRSVRLMIWGIPLRGPRRRRGGLNWTGGRLGRTAWRALGSHLDGDLQRDPERRQGERGAGDGADLRGSRVVRYRVLGPLEVTGPDGNPLDVGGAKPRALLTLLLGD